VSAGTRNLSAGSSRNRLGAWLLAWLLLTAPSIAEACSKCLSGRSDETKLAYILTTVFLSLLPLLAIGGVVWWLVRRARALTRVEAAVATPPAQHSA
jgi:hypothetical protein